MIRRTPLRRVLAACAAAAALVGIAATASSASAAGPVAAHTATVISPVDQLSGSPGDTPDVMSACPDFSFCIWKNADYNHTPSTGFWHYDFFNLPHDQWIGVGPNAAGQASSLWNNRDVSTLITESTSPNPPTGEVACVPANTAYKDLAARAWPNGDNANDSIVQIYLSTVNHC
jgi:hypothetical protein